MAQNTKAGWLHIRVTPELLNRLKDRADAVGVTTSEWARRILELAVMDANLTDTQPMITAALENVVQAAEVHAFQARFYSLTNYYLLLGLIAMMQTHLPKPDTPDPLALAAVAQNAGRQYADAARERAVKAIRSRSDIPAGLAEGDERSEDHNTTKEV